MADIVQASDPAEIDAARSLFVEYAEWLGFDLCFQGFGKELAELPGKYAPPTGRLYLLRNGNEYIGCIALREIETGICEMKRLYVKPAYRSKGYGKLLAERIIKDAKEIGYVKMRFDTIGEKMKSAMAIYKALGFREIASYYHNPQDGVVYMELYLANN